MTAHNSEKVYDTLMAWMEEMHGVVGTLSMLAAAPANIIAMKDADKDTKAELMHEAVVNGVKGANDMIDKAIMLEIEFNMIANELREKGCARPVPKSDVDGSVDGNSTTTSGDE